MTLGESYVESSPSDFGREELFLQLFLGYERRIYAFIFALVPNWSDADDILQETSVVLVEQVRYVQAGFRFSGLGPERWRFQVLNYRKKQKSSLARLSNQCVEALADQMIVQREEASDQRGCSPTAWPSSSPRSRADPTALSARCDNAKRRPSGGASLKAVYKALNRIHMQLLLCVRRSLEDGGRVMSDDCKHLGELEELLGALREGVCTDSQWERLNALLLADPEARQLYLEHSELCSILHHYQGHLLAPRSPRRLSCPRGGQTRQCNVLTETSSGWRRQWSCSQRESRAACSGTAE